MREALNADGRGLAPLGDREPLDARDAILTLLVIQDLHTAPLDDLRGAERWQHHPALASLKLRLERQLAAALGDRPHRRVGDPVSALRIVADVERTPHAYEWIATRATRRELVDFLAVQGGPGGRIDALASAARVGLDGDVAVALAAGCRDGAGHAHPGRAELQHRAERALGVDAPPRASLPIEALERTALEGMLVTNRALQPELIGALALVELRCGPRTRQVLEGLRRVAAPAEAIRAYEAHALADPRRARDWLDRVVAPLALDRRWSSGMVRGARWYARIDGRLLARSARYARRDRTAA